jgi:chromosome segregation ATPase
MRRPTHALIVMLLAMGNASLASAQGDQQVARLRDQLRQTISELRQFQAENGQLKVDLERARQEAEAATAAGNAAAAAELGEVTSERDALRSRLGAQDTELAQLRASLAEWRNAHGKATEFARTRDADATRFEGLYREVDTHVDRCERDNAALVGISRELLERYKQKGIWQAARSSEPLTGLGRLELERLAQEYHGRVVDSTLQPLDPASRPEPAQNP